LKSPCPVCSGTDFTDQTWLRDNRTGAFEAPFRVARCLGCGLLGLRPMPTEEELLAGYRRGYGPYARGDGGRRGVNRPANARMRLADAMRRSWHVLNGDATIDRIALKGRVLDVGAGQGENVEYLVRHGYQAVGLEPNPLAARVCEEKGLPVLCGTLDSVSLEPETFDTVILSQVIEHLVDPERSLDLVYRLLRPGGTVVIFTPNPQGTQARLFGRNWAHWHVPYHVYLYSPIQLRRLLTQSRFVVKRMATVSPAYWLRMSAHLWRHRSQQTGWILPAGARHFGYATRLAIAPVMRAVDGLMRGDCLLAIGAKP
jgi:SAM-dependent methyltransferase